MLDFPLLPEQASTLASRVDNLYFFLVAMTVVMTTLICVVLLYFTVRFRRRRKAEVGSGLHGSVPLEILWTAIPLAIVIGLFFWGTDVYFDLQRPPDDAIEMYAISKQWMWKFQHPNGKREVNDLHVPVGKAIKMTMTSQDVIHSFYIPAFRIKQDVLPGRYTTAWFQATKPGRYHLFCAEYCGAEHSQMIGQVIVQEPEAYAKWLVGGAGNQSLAEAGEALFASMACNTCHSDDDTGRGPSLIGVFGSQVTLNTGRVLTADETYLRESILDPASKLVAGHQPIMPTYKGQISEEGILKLISYVKSLSDGESAEAEKTDAETGSAEEIPEAEVSR